MDAVRKPLTVGMAAVCVLALAALGWTLAFTFGFIRIPRWVVEHPEWITSVGVAAVAVLTYVVIFFGRPSR